MSEPRWALWNTETNTWDEVSAENAPGEWHGGHEYGDPRSDPAATLRAVAQAVSDYWRETDVRATDDAYVVWERDEMDRRMAALRAALLDPR